MATKIATAQKRLFQDVYVCKNCSKKIRTQAVKVLTGKVKCPRCDARAFRAIKRK